MHLEELGIPFTELGEEQEIELFHAISQSLVSKRTLEEILQLIVTMSATVMRSKICSLMLLDEEKNELSIKATQALSAGYANKPNVKVGESVSGRAVKDRRLVIVPDVLRDPAYGFPEIAKAEGFVAMVSAPMIVADRVIGVINIYTTEKRDFRDVEIKVLQTVANQAALAIESTRLRQENERMKQHIEERGLVEEAKKYLMEKEGMSYSAAAAALVAASRDRSAPLGEVARSVILVHSLKSSRR